MWTIEDDVAPIICSFALHRHLETKSRRYWRVPVKLDVAVHFFGTANGNDMQLPLLGVISRSDLIRAQHEWVERDDGKLPFRYIC